MRALLSLLLLFWLPAHADNICASALAQNRYPVTCYGAKAGTSTDQRTKIAAAITAASATQGVVTFPAGKYRVVPTLADPGIYVYTTGVSLEGTGGRTAEIDCVPVVDNTRCVKFAKSPAGELVGNSMKGFVLYSADTTLTKVAIEMIDMDSAEVYDVEVVSYWGGDSTGLIWKGRDTSTLRRVRLQAALPLRISVNPNYPAPGSPWTVSSSSGTFASGTGQIIFTTAVPVSGTYSFFDLTNGRTYTGCTAIATSATITTCTNASGAPTNGDTFAGNGSYSADHLHVVDLYTLTGRQDDAHAYTKPATLPKANILVDDYVVMTDVIFDGYQAWVGGQYGFYSDNTNAPAVWYGIRIDNSRKEQGDGYTNGAQFYIHSTAHQVQQFTAVNTYCDDNTINIGPCYDFDGVDFATFVGILANGTTVDVGKFANGQQVSWQDAYVAQHGTVTHTAYTLRNASTKSTWDLPQSGQWGLP